MDHEKNIKKLKLSSLERSFKKNFSILDNNSTIIGSLVPIGHWLLDDLEIIDKISQWRTKFNRMFPTRNKVTRETTLNYINKNYISNDRSILFLIYTPEKKLVGHVGLSNFNKKSFELVNLIRGASGGADELIYFAESALLNFGFSIGNQTECFIELMSYNWIVKDLHERIGFKKISSHPLQKLLSNDSVTHLKVSNQQKNVSYTTDIYSITKKDFYKRKIHSK